MLKNSNSEKRLNMPTQRKFQEDSVAKVQSGAKVHFSLDQRSELEDDLFSNEDQKNSNNDMPIIDDVSSDSPKENEASPQSNTN